MVKPWPTTLYFGITAEQAERLWPRDPSFRPDKLRLARQARMWSMRELAAHTGISARRISDFERNRDAPSGNEKARLGEALSFPALFFAQDDLVIDVRNGIASICRFGRDDDMTGGTP